MKTVYSDFYLQSEMENYSFFPWAFYSFLLILHDYSWNVSHFETSVTLNSSQLALLLKPHPAKTLRLFWLRQSEMKQLSISLLSNIKQQKSIITQQANNYLWCWMWLFNFTPSTSCYPYMGFTSLSKKTGKNNAASIETLAEPHPKNKYLNLIFHLIFL